MPTTFNTDICSLDYITLITVIVHVEVRLLKKVCLFGGYVRKNEKDVFKMVRKKNHNIACASNKRLIFNSMERREHYPVILKNLACFVKCVSI